MSYSSLKDFQEAKAKKAAVDKQKAENTENNKAREPSVFSQVQIEKEEYIMNELNSFDKDQI